METKERKRWHQNWPINRQFLSQFCSIVDNSNGNDLRFLFFRNGKLYLLCKLCISEWVCVWATKGAFIFIFNIVRIHIVLSWIVYFRVVRFSNTSFLSAYTTGSSAIFIVQIFLKTRTFFIGNYCQKWQKLWGYTLCESKKILWNSAVYSRISENIRLS